MDMSDVKMIKLPKWYFITEAGSKLYPCVIHDLYFCKIFENVAGLKSISVTCRYCEFTKPYIGICCSETESLITKWLTRISQHGNSY